MNRPTHFELHTTDPEASAEFFRNVFGWAFSKWDGPDEYWLVDTTGGASEQGSCGINGGLMRSRDGQPRTVNTLTVSDVDEYCAKITAGGGQICVPKMAIPGVGYLAYALDPRGVLFGISHMDPAAK